MPTASLPSPRAARQHLGPLLFALAWLAGFGMLQYSVVRFRVRILLTLTAACLLLVLWLVRRSRLNLTPGLMALILPAGAALGLLLPLFSYLPLPWEWAARGVLALGACVAAAALWRGRSGLAWGSAVAAYAVSSAIAIRTDPAPKIDVWVTLQQASDALARGENFYSVTWVDSPGIQDAFTYLPWTAVLLAPGRWLAGDVRWMQLVWAVVLAIGIWQLGSAIHSRSASAHASVEAVHRDPHWIAAAATALILLVPGTLTQIDQAWTEPLLLTGIVWWAVLVVRGHAWWAVLPLALACASKQHLALVLPLLLLWRPFGPARAIATGAATGALIAPWFLTAPADFVHDTITLLVGFHPIRFANTWYLFFLNEYGITLPFYATAIVVLGALASALIMVARRQPPLGELLRWIALVLFAANIVNKQAFYNQYWLVGTLVALSLVADRLTDRLAQPSEQPSPPARPVTR